MLVSRLPKYYTKVMHYEVIKCVKCGEISVVKAPMYKPIYILDGRTRSYLNPDYSDLRDVIKTYHTEFGSYDVKEKIYLDDLLSGNEIPIGEEEDCIDFADYDSYTELDSYENIPIPLFRRILNFFRFAKKDRYFITKLSSSYNCIDGICQNCIDKENITIVLNEDNPVSNYRNAYDNYMSKHSYIFHTSDISVPNHITNEFLADLNADAYNSVICGSDPKTTEEKHILAEKYVESAKADIIDCIISKIQSSPTYKAIKNTLGNTLNATVEFLQKSGRRVYRCSNINYHNDLIWKKANRCPCMPDAVVSDSKFYKLEERYNAEKTLIKINERMNKDLYSEFEYYFKEFFDTLKSKIATSHIWDVYE